ncbi:MAG: M48 family metallopeptidase [Fimbriimonadaceae bacterium]|nr:M48 family metallopeptidase [Fimbriimonadaceae bacterium]QYK55312.1 MAG: M48 family metallopeptidase [Fimbriimonadaceae bacterium]
MSRKPKARLHFEEPFELALPSRTVAVALRRSTRARRARLQVSAAGVTLTVPERLPRREAIDAALKFAAWIDRHLKKIEGERVGEEAALLWRGEPLEIVEGGGPFLEGSCLTVPEGWDRARIGAALREYADPLLRRRVEELGAVTGLRPSKVRILDQRTKWGACTARGTVTLNWRLAMAPPAVMDYVLLHELCHLRELNHSARFWALVETHCPDWREHRGWLRRHGASLGAR